MDSADSSLDLAETNTPSQSDIETFTIGEDAGYDSYEDCCTRCASLQPPPLPPFPPSPISPPPAPPNVPPPPPHPLPPPGVLVVQAASASVIVPGSQPCRGIKMWQDSAGKTRCTLKTSNHVVEDVSKRDTTTGYYSGYTVYTMPSPPPPPFQPRSGLCMDFMMIPNEYIPKDSANPTGRRLSTASPPPPSAPPPRSDSSGACVDSCYDSGYTTAYCTTNFGTSADPAYTCSGCDYCSETGNDEQKWLYQHEMYLATTATSFGLSEQADFKTKMLGFYSTASDIVIEGVRAYADGSRRRRLQASTDTIVDYTAVFSSATDAASGAVLVSNTAAMAILSSQFGYTVSSHTTPVSALGGFERFILVSDIQFSHCESAADSFCVSQSECYNAAAQVVGGSNIFNPSGLDVGDQSPAPYGCHVIIDPAGAMPDKYTLRYNTGTPGSACGATIPGLGTVTAHCIERAIPPPPPSIPPPVAPPRYVRQGVSQTSCTIPGYCAVISANPACCGFHWIQTGSNGLPDPAGSSFHNNDFTARAGPKGCSASPLQDPEIRPHIYHNDGSVSSSANADRDLLCVLEADECADTSACWTTPPSPPPPPPLGPNELYGAITIKTEDVDERASLVSNPVSNTTPSP